MMMRRAVAWRRYLLALVVAVVTATAGCADIDVDASNAVEEATDVADEFANNAD